jgi:hypothetical protein
MLRKFFQKLKHKKAKKFTLIFISKNKCELFIQYLCKTMRTFYLMFILQKYLITTGQEYFFDQ